MSVDVFENISVGSLHHISLAVLEWICRFIGLLCETSPKVPNKQITKPYISVEPFPLHQIANLTRSHCHD